MNPLEAAVRYFDAWNRRSPDDILASIQPGGTYEDPLTGGPLTGAAIGQYAAGLFAAFPDLSFELASLAEAGANAVAAQWIMRGVNTGSMQGAPPTGNAVTLPGADFITIQGGKVASVRGYFDTAEVPRQLGMQVLVQPKAVGPVQFGYSTYMNLGNTAAPGAFGITSLRVRSEEEAERVVSHARKVLQQMPAMKGFIGVVTGRAGDHMFTVTAWETPDDPGQLRGGAHKDALDAFFGPGFTYGGVTSVWIPHHFNPVWVRCGVCDAMSVANEKGATCRAGHPLPDPPPYW
jgi:steroid delta-isomerase-like uncharacterized protein